MSSNGLLRLRKRSWRREFTNRLARLAEKVTLGLRTNLMLEDGLACTGTEPGSGLLYDKLGALLPVVDYDPVEKLAAVSTAEGERCDLGFVIELAGQTGVDEQIRESLHALLAVGMPVGSILALTTYASPKVEPFVETWRAARVGELSVSAAACDNRQNPAGATDIAPDAQQFLLRQADARAQALLEAAFTQPFPSAPVEVRRFRVFLSVVLKGESPDRAASRERAKAMRAAMVSILSQNALFSHVWGPADWLALAGEMLNPQAVRAGEWEAKEPNPFEELRSQCVDRPTRTRVHLEGVEFSGLMGPADPKRPRTTETGSRVTVTALTAEAFSAPISLASTASLLGESGRAGAQIPCPFALTTVYEVPNEAAERNNANLRNMRCRQMSMTPLGQITTYYAQQLEELELALESFKEGGIARMAQSLLLFAPSERVKECVHAAASIGRRAGVRFEPAVAMHMQNLFMAIPLCASPALMKEAALMKRFPRRTVPATVNSFPVKTESQGTGTRSGTNLWRPQLIGVGRKGGIALFDLFANRNGGFSATVVGKPGSGKSVVLNELALANLAAGGITRLIDVGRSHEKSCALLGGQFLELSDANVWDLNPFAFATIESVAKRAAASRQADGQSEAQKEGQTQGPKGFTRAALSAEMAESLERVRDIVRELMTAKGLTDIEETILGDAIARVAWRAFEENTVGTLDALYEALIDAKTPTGEPERRALDLAAMLTPYVKGAPLAKWFDGTGKRIDFTNRFMVVELEGLSNMKRLRSAVLMSLMLAFRHEMERLPLSQTKLVVIDEAWDLMGEGSAGAFIETGYRRARKHNGSFITATQSVADYLKSDTARAAWASTDTRIYLRQDDASLKALESLTSDSDPAAPWRKAAIQSLTTVSGAWSEMLIESGNMPGFILRLFLDRYSIAAYSSHAVDRARHQAWLDAGASVAEAVVFCAEGLQPEDTPRAAR